MKDNVIIVTLVLSSGKTAMFNTVSRYVPAIKSAIEDSGKHDRHKLTSVFKFIPKEQIEGPDISVCMYDVVLMTYVTMADAQEMQQKAKSNILVPTTVQKPKVFRKEG